MRLVCLPLPPDAVARRGGTAPYLSGREQCARNPRLVAASSIVEPVSVLHEADSTVDNPAMALSDRTALQPDDGFGDALAGARAGTPAECRVLYESLAGRVHGYLRLHGADDPEDLTSEVFLRVFTHLDDFTGDEHGFSAWVFTIAHRALIDDRRRLGRRPITVELTESIPEGLVASAAEDTALQTIDDDVVQQLLNRLTPDQRDVLTLRIVADLGIEQVATVLNKTPGTVKALQHRGIAALRRELQGLAS